MSLYESENAISHGPKEAKEELPLKRPEPYIGVADTHIEYASRAPNLEPKPPEPTFQMKVVSDTQQTSTSQNDQSSPICMESYKREWYKGYIKTKTYERSDPFGFSSASVSRDPSRTPSPMPHNTSGKYHTACSAALNSGGYGKVEGFDKKKA